MTELGLREDVWTFPKKSLLEIILSLMLLAGCALAPKNSHKIETENFYYVAHLATIIENDVQVNVVLEKDEKEQWVLAATYKPTQEDFHLYSKDLPLRGINGVGRPTRLEISSSQIDVINGLIESTPAQLYEFPKFDEPFPMNPVGPITLRQAINIPQDTHKPTKFKIRLTYMACSHNGVCLPPVVGREINLDLEPKMEGE